MGGRLKEAKMSRLSSSVDSARCGAVRGVVRAADGLVQDCEAVAQEWSKVVVRFQ